MSLPPIVAFQGTLGAWSHLSCRAFVPNHTVLPCRSFDAAFDAVEQGRADLALLPVENSRAGRVTDFHRLLPQRPLHLVGEHYQPVAHQLMGLPGATLEGIRRVRSHPQALEQCRNTLERLGIEAVADHDTAGAAAEVAEAGDASVGALASPLAAEIYGLQILLPDAQDDDDNTTRFLALAREPLHVLPNHGPLVTSCLFRVRNLPAALYKGLGGFATNGVNLLKLESWQMPGFQWTQFAIDFEGHTTKPSVAHALEELAFFSDELRVLGSYPAHPYRWRAGR